MTKAVRRLKNFDFSGDNAAVALVNQDQGGPANGTETLLMKAKDVRLELSMSEFLTRFFHMWRDDAEFLANLLGYEVENPIFEWEHELEDSATIIKKRGESAKELLTKAKETPVEKFEGSERKHLEGVIGALSKSAGVKITDFEEPSKEDPNQILKDHFHSNSNEVNDMTQETEPKTEAEVEKARKDAYETAQAEQAEVVKGLQAELKKFREEREKAEHEKFVEKAKGYDVLGVDEEKSDAFATALKKMEADEELSVVSEVLEKALNIAKNAGDIAPKGHDMDASMEEREDVTKSRNNVNAALGISE